MAGSRKSEVSADDIDAALNSGKNARFLLNEKIPVYITYVSVTAGNAGQTVFWRDVYNRVEKTAAPEQVKQAIPGGGVALHFAEEIAFSVPDCPVTGLR